MDTGKPEPDSETTDPIDREYGQFIPERFDPGRLVPGTIKSHTCSIVKEV